MSFVLDTDISSAWMKGHAAVSNRFIQYGGGLCVSTVTLGEDCDEPRRRRHLVRLWLRALDRWYTKP